MFNLIFSPDFLYLIIRISSPILFAALAAVVCTKAGIMNLGLEGTMMLSALFGSLVSYYTGSWPIGLLVAIVTGIVVGIIMCVFAYKLDANLTLVGTAINLIGGGGCVFLVKSITAATEGKAYTDTVSFIASSMLIPKWDIPIIKNIPILGEILSGHCILTYFAFLCVFLLWVLLYKTPLGLSIRSVGENPNAASSVGISVIKVKYITFAISGILLGFGGAYMSMYYSMGWTQSIVSGRGFIALAAEAMGPEPLSCLLSTMLFSAADALSVKVTALGIDSNLVCIIPYAFTIIGLVVFSIIESNKEKKRRANDTNKVEKASS